MHHVLVSQAAGLLEAAFWPQWHTVLGHWLANAPDMDQVVAWFSGWKALLPQVPATPRRRNRVPGPADAHCLRNAMRLTILP